MINKDNKKIYKRLGRFLNQTNLNGTNFAYRRGNKGAVKPAFNRDYIINSIKLFFAFIDDVRAVIKLIEADVKAQNELVDNISDLLNPRFKRLSRFFNKKGRIKKIAVAWNVYRNGDFLELLQDFLHEMKVLKYVAGPSEHIKDM